MLYEALTRGAPSLLPSKHPRISNPALDISRISESKYKSFIKNLNEYKITDWLRKRTVGICHATDDGNPTLTGTGILLRIADVGFIISAGHVLCATEKSDNLNLLIAPNDGDAGLIGMPHIEIGRTHDLNNTDFGFARLSPEINEYLGEHKTFLRLADIALETHPTGGAYSIFGYPREWAKLDPIKEMVSLDPICFTSHLYRGVLSDVEEGVSIALAFPAADYRLIDGPRERVPALQGISGCGIWRMYGPEHINILHAWNPSFVRLAGVEHSVVSRKAIKGTLIKHVVHGIIDCYPNLRNISNLITDLNY